MGNELLKVLKISHGRGRTSLRSLAEQTTTPELTTRYSVGR